MKAVIYFANYGPYHRARARKLHELSDGRVRFVEIAGSERTYSWVSSARAGDPEIHTVFRGPYEQAKLWPTLTQCIREATRFGADTLFIPGYHEPLWLLLALWARLSGKRTVLMLDSHSLDRPRVGWKERLKGQLVRTLFQRAFIAGKATQAYLTTLGFSGPTWTGYDVVDNDFFADGATGEYAPYLIAINRLVPEKNVAALLSGYSLYSKLSPHPWRLLILGDGELETALREQITQLGLQGAVELRGFLQSEEVRPLLQRSGALVLYSLSEPWGLVVNEALAAGRPVIVSDRAGAASDLVEEGKNGFVVSPLDPSELAHAMLRTERLTAEDRLAGAGHSQQVLAQFTPLSWAQAVLAAAEIPNRR